MRVSLSPWSNEPEGVRRLSYGALIRRAALPGTAVLLLLAVACGASSDTSDSTAAVSAPAGDEPTPSTSATATVTTGEMRCTPGLAIADQKAVLVAIVKEQLSGTTSHDSEMTRLEIDPDPRDHRQGGIWMVMEFNGDEFDSVEEKKSAMDREMRDVYEALYTAGCEDLREVHISGRARAIDGRVGIAHAIVFKTKLERDRADEVDWTEKETLDFNDVWDTMLLNVRWRRELAGEGE